MTDAHTVSFAATRSPLADLRRRYPTCYAVVTVGAEVRVTLRIGARSWEAVPVRATGDEVGLVGCSLAECIAAAARDGFGGQDG